MQYASKTIPVLYFYLLSAVGMILIIIGLFNSFKYAVNTIAYDKYPLQYGSEMRCTTMYPPFSSAETVPQKEKALPNEKIKEDCLKGLEEERQIQKVNDLQNSIAYTVIGSLVFGIHFYFARSTGSGQAQKERKEDK